MGVLGYARIADDFYPTPEWCTKALLKHFKPQNAIWEPACGEGHISKVLIAENYRVYSSDLVPRGYGYDQSCNFLKQTQLFSHDIRTIITNPPYHDDMPEQFIRHSLKLLEPVKGAVALLLRNEYDCAKGRSELFRYPAFHMKLVLTKRPKWIEGSTGSPRHNYAFYIWDFLSSGDSPTIRWDQ